jgi:hypothetical protein
MATIKKGLKKAQEGEKLGLTYTTPRGKKYSLPQGAAGPLKITRPNGSTRTIEDREKYTRKMRRVVGRNTVNGVRQGTMEREKNGGAVKNKMKNGGSLSALNASNKRDKGIDPKGAFTKVQKKALAGAKGKATLTKDKQLGATKMAKRGMSIKKK